MRRDLYCRAVDNTQTVDTLTTNLWAKKTGFSTIDVTKASIKDLVLLENKTDFTPNLYCYDRLPILHWDANKDGYNDLLYLSQKEDITSLYIYDKLTNKCADFSLYQGDYVLSNGTSQFLHVPSDTLNKVYLYLHLFHSAQKKHMFHIYEFDVNSMQSKLLYESQLCVNAKLPSPLRVANYPNYIFINCATQNKIGGYVEVLNLKNNNVSSIFIPGGITLSVTNSIGMLSGRSLYVKTNDVFGVIDIRSLVDDCAIEYHGFCLDRSLHSECCGLLDQLKPWNNISSISNDVKCVGDSLVICYERKQKLNTEDYTGVTFYKYNTKSHKLNVYHYNNIGELCRMIYYGDFDGDGINNILFTYKKNGLAYLGISEERNHSSIVSVPILIEELYILQCHRLENDNHSFANTANHDYLLRLRTPFAEKILEYHKNPKYYLNYVLYASIIALVVLITLFIRVRIIAKRTKLELQENKIRILQLESLTKELDPHFIFNTLNSLGSMIFSASRDDSYDYLSKVSSLLRTSLKQSTILNTIDHELNYTRDFLEIQQKRFKDSFRFVIKLDSEVNRDQKIPTNILSNLVDNCIKHGFRDINYRGVITIEFVQQDEGILLLVDDNGVGYNKYHSNVDDESSTGKGLFICENYVDIFNAKRKDNLLYFVVSNRNDKNKTTGTRCQFYIPNDIETSLPKV